MLSPRWRKLWRDVRLAPGRVLLMMLAVGCGVFALSAMLGSYTILQREIARNYRASNPPSATLTLDSIDAALLDAVRRQPGILAAQASATVGATVRAANGEWLPLLIFVTEDFGATRIGVVRPDSGAWPPADGSLLLERDAAHLLDGRTPLLIRRRDGAEFPLPVAGTVHDAALPPAASGMTVYAYARPPTIAALGIDSRLRQLKIIVSDPSLADQRVTQLARWLQSQGRRVERIQVPPAGRHPHQGITDAVLSLQLACSALTLVLGAVITATVLQGMLARQIRQIGVMRAIGASTWQVAALYLLLVAVLSALATAGGMVAGVQLAQRVSAALLQRVLNFTMESAALPATTYAVLACCGILLPLMAALPPVLLACTRPVHRVLFAGSGASLGGLTPAWLARLPLALRNTLRQRARFILNVSLLGIGGALYLASANLRLAADEHLAQAAADRLHDVEILLDRPADSAAVQRALTPVAALVEAWPRALASRVGVDGMAIERTYPDGNHGALALMAVPDHTSLLALALQAGRWLNPGEDGTTVLNSRALEVFPGTRPGDLLTLASRGRTLRLRVVGIATQFMSPATLFVTPRTFAPLAQDPAQAEAYRVRLTQHDAPAINAATARMETLLRQAGIAPRLSITEPMMRKDVDGHFDLLLTTLRGFAALAGAVGLVGLGSSLIAAVSERRREFGILHCLGAPPAAILRMVMLEAAGTALLSIPLACAAAAALAWALGRWLGELLFGLPFPLAVNLSALAAWMTLVLAGSILASAWPAWHAARSDVARALADT